jgi:acylphosphatase
MNKQVHVVYAGRVQGVGFRFTAEEIAHQLGVKGWVKNLRNGRVEIVAEAEETTLKEFLDRIKEYFSEYIQAVDIDWLEATLAFDDFEITF